MKMSTLKLCDNAKKMIGLWMMVRWIKRKTHLYIYIIICVFNEFQIYAQ